MTTPVCYQYVDGRWIWIQMIDGVIYVGAEA